MKLCICCALRLNLPLNPFSRIYGNCDHCDDKRNIYELDIERRYSDDKPSPDQPLQDDPDKHIRLPE